MLVSWKKCHELKEHYTRESATSSVISTTLIFGRSSLGMYFIPFLRLSLQAEHPETMTSASTSTASRTLTAAISAASSGSSAMTLPPPPQHRAFKRFLAISTKSTSTATCGPPARGTRRRATAGWRRWTSRSRTTTCGRARVTSKTRSAPSLRRRPSCARTRRRSPPCSASSAWPPTSGGSATT